MHGPYAYNVKCSIGLYNADFLIKSKLGRKPQRTNSYTDMNIINHGETNSNTDALRDGTQSTRFEAPPPDPAKEFLERLDHRTSKVVGSSLLNRSEIEVGKRCTMKGDYNLVFLALTYFTTNKGRFGSYTACVAHYFYFPFVRTI